MTKRLIGIFLAATLWVAGCSADGGSGDRSGGGSGGTDGTTMDGSMGGTTPLDGGIPDVGPNPDAFFADDPPPMQCLPDGTMGPAPEPPGGTPECPDDKNREGCRCDEIGSTAPCWPGKRVNRERGICRDGTTTCEPYDEFTGRWGACEGFILPEEGARLGPEACRCFSAGLWDLDNTSPCFITSGSDVHAVSTIIEGGVARCPEVTEVPVPVPSSPWSPNRLTVDCAGKFELCFAIKAGDAEAPSDSDCEVAKVCVEAWYEEAGVTQEMPVLPAWSGDDPACAKRFQDGGYGEMSVRGLSVECDPVDDGSGGYYVFNRVPYCPAICNEEPERPECERCRMGGSGSF